MTFTVRLKVVDPAVTTGAVPIKLSTATGAIVPEYVSETETGLPVYVPSGTDVVTGAIPVTELPA